MAQKKEKTIQELLQDQMIIKLALAGIPQRQIRAVVGVNMHRVTDIVKHLKIKEKSDGK